jgi:hypothetical protein
MLDEMKLPDNVSAAARAADGDVIGAERTHRVCRPTLPLVRRKDRKIRHERRDADNERKRAICSDSRHCRTPFLRKIPTDSVRRGYV